MVDSWGKEGKGGGGGLERSGTGESLVGEGRGKKGGGKGQVQAQDLKVAFRGLQTAWIRLVGNPFFVVDEGGPRGGGGEAITSKRFEEEVRRIGDGWRPGLTVL